MGCKSKSDSTLIRIKVSTHKSLTDIKDSKETFDDVINKLLFAYLKRKVSIEELKVEIKTELTDMLLAYLKVKGVEIK